MVQRVLYSYIKWPKHNSIDLRLLPGLVWQQKTDRNSGSIII